MGLPGQFQFFKKAQNKNFSPLRCFYERKTVAFVVFCSLVFILLVGFGSIYIFVGLKFCAKKNNLT